MKKKIIIPVVILALIAVIVLVVISITSLPGKYYLVNLGEMPEVSQELFSTTEYLVFKSDTVEFALPGLGGDDWGTNFIVSCTYTIEDDVIIMWKNDGSEMFRLDFKKDGSTIYLGDSEWKKGF
jgi:hypothetical protein